MGIITTIQRIARNRTTYAVGLLQTKAYRILKTYTAKGLATHEISTVEWALLGLLYDAPDGKRSRAVADELGVEAPFVTTIVAKLKKNELIEVKSDPTDNRAKMICLTSKGNDFVYRVEIELRAHMKPLLKGVSPSQIISYLTVLEKMIENSEKLQ